MTERGLPGVDSAQACPFVAFEDDREARAATPDHRHRCYAELVPSPRAAAHQEAYCLSNAFPVCPTFQDWARREAAHARGVAEHARDLVGPEAPAVAPEAAGAPHAAATGPRSAGSKAGGDRASGGDRGPDDDHDAGDEPPLRHPPLDAAPPIRRNPPRDWAAPPPWAPGGGGAGTAAGRREQPGDTPGTPGLFAGRDDESRGLAGSAADRLAAGSAARGTEPPGAFDRSGSAVAPDEELAGLVGGRRTVELPGHDRPVANRSVRRPSVSSTRSSRDRDRERERDAIVGPSWERARRYEAYPAIRSRAGLPPVPRLAVLAGALFIAAVALFFLPALLGVGGGGDDRGSGAPSAGASAGSGSASPSLEPATPAAPTAQVYVVEAGDTMSKIAARFGLTLEELCDANKEAIPDCDKIDPGDEVAIPTKPPNEFTEPSASPS